MQRKLVLTRGSDGLLEVVDYNDLEYDSDYIDYEDFLLSDLPLDGFDLQIRRKKFGGDKNVMKVNNDSYELCL